MIIPVAGSPPAPGPHPAPRSPHEALRPAPGRLACAGSGAWLRHCLPSYKRRTILPADRGTPPPAPASLRWPDGRLSAGTVRTTPAGPLFAVDRADVVLAERGNKGPAAASSARLGTVLLAAEPGDRPDVFVPRLPSLPQAPGLGERWFGTGQVWHSPTLDGTTAATPLALTRDALAAVVGVAGGTPGERLDWNQQAIVQHLLAHGLQRVAPQCADPAEAVRVAQALHSDHELFLLYGLPALEASAGQACASFDAKAFKRHLAGLRPGQHGYVRVTLVHGDTAHALAIAVRKEGRRQVRLAAINPAGWPQVSPGDAGPPGHDRVVPAVFRRMDVDAAAAALAGLLAGPLPAGPAPNGVHDWVCSGQPLHAWLAGLGAAPAGGLQADFHGTGRPLLTAPQKADDCTVERIFAFMASALPPADYKLAKAAGLNLLVQLADRLEPPDTAVPDPALEAARSYLQWRLTSSLSGSAVARAQSAAG